MTTNPAPQAAHGTDFVQLPDPPEPEDMNNFKFLHGPGNSQHLPEHFGHEDTTIVTGEAYISRAPTSSRQGCSTRTCSSPSTSTPKRAATATATSSRSRASPRTLFWEIASPTTGRRDVTVKRDGYAAMGIPEYWRFDDSGGRHHGAPLAGDRLVDGVYQPIPIERIDDRTHQGYSTVLDLHLRWEDGRLGWYDPATGRHIPRFRDERDRANAEQEARIQAEARAERAEARARELEAELRRRRQP